MSQEIINKTLQNNLLSPLTVDHLWSQFLHAFSYEIDNLRTQFGTIKNIYNLYENDKDGIVRIAETFGYEPNLVINNSQYMARKETESIPYRIKRKTTYDGYYMILQQNAQLGEVFSYYYDNYKLVKAIDYKNTIKNLNTYSSNHDKPFYGVSSVKNFSSFINSNTIMLDYREDGKIVYPDNKVENLRLYSLDQSYFNPCWRLDKSYTKIPTKHLGIEYFPQHYYCEYFTNLGVAVEEIDTYSTYFKLKEYYIPKSIKITINNKILDLIITETNDVEYYSDNEGVLNPQSNYNISSGELTLIFDDIPNGHEIIVSYNIDLFITSDYFYCLEFGADYNKRCPIIPHTGFFITADIKQGRGSDGWSPNSNEENYTIPDLKLKAITSSSYNREITVSEKMILDNATDSEGHPSGKENFKLDSTIKWFLDSSSESSAYLDKKFKYIAYGDGALPIMNDICSDVFSYKNLLFSYNLNTDDDSEKILDASKNKIDCTVVGNTVKIDSIINKSLNFNGQTYAYSNSRLNIVTNENYSLGIWFNANQEPTTSIETIFDNFINISYDYENEKLLLDSNEIDCSKNEPHFLCINFNGIDSEMSIYLDSILIDTIAYSLPSSSNFIYIGCDISNQNLFFGQIDNLWMMNKTINLSTIKYVYDNKITIISHMGNRLGYYELSENEIYKQIDEYTIIQSYVKAMDVVHEISMINDETSNYYVSQTKFKPIYNPYFSIKYYDNSHELVTLYANEKGNFYRKIDDTHNEMITGNINFETGIWNLAKNTIKSVSENVIKTPDEEVIPTAYKFTTQGTSDWYYRYDDITATVDPSDKIDADYIDTKGYENYEKISIYVSNDDASNQKIHTDNNGETYYVYKQDEVAPPKTYIKMFNVVGNSDTNLFSTDDGKTLYLQLSDLLNVENNLHAFVDLGEASSTTIYTKTDISSEQLNPSTIVAYLDVGCKKQIRKWKSSSTFAYTLGTNTSIYYSDLSFNNIIELSNPQEEDFNPLEVTIKTDPTDFNLKEISIIEKYEPVSAITYIRGFNNKITLLDIELISGSITIDFWMTISGKLERLSATVDADGNVTGPNIRSGNFDYDTNMLEFEFVEPINSEIITSYEYYSSLDIDISQSLVTNYKVTKNIKINEIGLEDENHELLAYMTFPNIEPNDIYNNISAMFAINTKS